MAQATQLSAQALTAAAKALIEAYNDKAWDRVRAGITDAFVYDEVATGRRITGSEAAVECWQGWARAFPDSKATFQAAHCFGQTVVLELTWKGTHKGTLETADGPVPATGKRIEVRACALFEMAEERATTQRHYFDMATMLRQLGIAG